MNNQPQPPSGDPIGACRALAIAFLTVLVLGTLALIIGIALHGR